MQQDEFLKNVKVVSDGEVNEADYLVCIPAHEPSPFTDNLTGFCVRCGIKVQFRWHAPLKPKRICIGCAATQVIEDTEKKT